MPQGVVIFAGNNCRLKGWAFRDLAGKRLGFLAIDKNGNLVMVPGDKTRKRYTVDTYAGVKMEVEAAAALKKTGTEVKSAATGGPIGKLVKEEVVDATGRPKLRCDSTGMFEVVANKLKKVHSLPGHLIKEFSNVHDDFDEGGTKDDSRTNFFNALKTAPGVGGASELDFFAYSGHGSSCSLPSAGVDRTHLPTLAKEIKRLVRSDGIVVFYACCTGTKDGFAQKLSGLLPSMTVWGHLKAGPASTNPNKVKYKAGVQDRFLEDLSKDQRLIWDTYMRSNDTFYARYPFMTREAIRAEVGV